MTRREEAERITWLAADGGPIHEVANHPTGLIRALLAATGIGGLGWLALFLTGVT